jgi:hypothetical protein
VQLILGRQRKSVQGINIDQIVPAKILFGAKLGTNAIGLPSVVKRSN